MSSIFKKMRKYCKAKKKFNANVKDSLKDREEDIMSDLRPWNFQF